MEQGLQIRLPIYILIGGTTILGIYMSTQERFSLWIGQPTMV